jgi:hypothetical protein
MRTGSFHQPTSQLSISDARPPALTTHQSKQRLDGNARVAFEGSKSPDFWPFAIRATFTGLRL